MHFYEGDGEPKLPEVLGVFHYWDCKGVTQHPTVRILLTGSGREPSFVMWTQPPRSDDDTDARYSS
jgi:hypothetical protein